MTTATVTSEARNEGYLEALQDLLCRGRFITASEIASNMGCSKPTAYARIRALIARGLPIQTMKTRVAGASGPLAVGYAIPDGEPRQRKRKDS